ncbi:UAA transporter [Aspergillus ambiguus]|uniref:putative UPD-GlcNAc transporter (Mnn2-2) n=1 Tax=Aspergillus ambiguus TaxID=176160 RepID=UPI003CCD0940
MVRHNVNNTETPRDSWSDGTVRHDTNTIGRKTESAELRSSPASIVAAVTHASIPSWTSIVLMVSLIFGGCCTNVFTLEAIIKEQPSSGPLITFAQFVLTALFTAPSFISLSAGPQSGFLTRPAIPLRSWIIYTAYFLSVNLLNNWAFAYKISVPLHIIIRSAGPVASMVIGYIYNGRRYSHGQMLAVAMLTVGVIASALADAHEKGQPINIGNDSSLTDSVVGFTILALAMALSAFQGIYADRLYETYGRDNWKEALFYSHTLSLPFFLPAYTHISTHFRGLLSSPSLLSQLEGLSGKWASALESTGSVGIGNLPTTDASKTGPYLTWIINATSEALAGLQNWNALYSALESIPMQVLFLVMNALTQYLCIRGVHLLAAKSSSLTVTIVLNVRKLVSLLISIHLFGNTLAPGVLVGALFVFVGGALYGFEGARLRKAKVKRS